MRKFGLFFSILIILSVNEIAVAESLTGFNSCVQNAGSTAQAVLSFDILNACAIQFGFKVESLADYQSQMAAAKTLGQVIPGVSVNVTPTCAESSSSSVDPVTGASRYSLFSQFGSPCSSVSTIKNIDLKIPAPRAVTIINSWAVIVE